MEKYSKHKNISLQSSFLIADTKSCFDVITSVHIYSLQKCKIKVGIRVGAALENPLNNMI